MRDTTTQHNERHAQALKVVENFLKKGGKITYLETQKDRPHNHLFDVNRFVQVDAQNDIDFD